MGHTYHSTSKIPDHGAQYVGEPFLFSNSNIQTRHFGSRNIWKKNIPQKYIIFYKKTGLGLNDLWLAVW